MMIAQNIGSKPKTICWVVVSIAPNGLQLNEVADLYLET
jgi:hypothetical protein